MKLDENPFLLKAIFDLFDEKYPNLKYKELEVWYNNEFIARKVPDDQEN